MDNEKKWYVYLLCDPDTQKPFYVGKGTGNRINEHEKTWRGIRNNPLKLQAIDSIHARGKQVLKKKVAEFDNEQDAYIYEWAMIGIYADSLTNIQYSGGSCRRTKKSHPDKRYEEKIPAIELAAKDVWTLEQVAHFFKLSPERALRLIKYGLPYTRIENHFLFDAQHVKTWARSLEVLTEYKA